MNLKFQAPVHKSMILPKNINKGDMYLCVQERLQKTQPSSEQQGHFKRILAQKAFVVVVVTCLQTLITHGSSLIYLFSCRNMKAVIYKQSGFVSSQPLGLLQTLSLKLKSLNSHVYNNVSSSQNLNFQLFKDYAQFFSQILDSSVMCKP